MRLFGARRPRPTLPRVRGWRGRGGDRGHALELLRPDEVFATVGGRGVCLWRATDGEGEVLDAPVQARARQGRGPAADAQAPAEAGRAPDTRVADRLGSYVAAGRELGLAATHVQAKTANNRAEGSHVPVRLRERKMQGFRRHGSTRRFLSILAAVANTCSTSRHLVSAGRRLLRVEAFTARRDAVARAA
jgi:transposase-like protein